MYTNLLIVRVIVQNYTSSTVRLMATMSPDKACKTVTLISNKQHVYYAFAGGVQCIRTQYQSVVTKDNMQWHTCNL